MNKSNILYYIIGTLIIIALLYSGTVHDSSSYNLADVDRNLPEEAIQTYQAKLDEGVGLLEEARAEADIEKEYGVLHHIAAQYYGLGNLSKAFEFYNKAAELMPENFIAFKEMSKVMNEAERYDSALEYIDRAIELKSDSASSWTMKLTLYEAHINSEYDPLLTVYNEAIAATDNHLNILTLYARFLERYDNYEFALKTWQQLAGMVYENELFIEEIERLEDLMGSQE